MPTRPTIYPLTALRFLFALAVFGHHCYFVTKADNAWISWFYHSFLYEGFIGVSFFFLLSGFILAYNYQGRLTSGEVTRGEFYLARVARIYPLHLLTLLIALPVTAGGIEGLFSRDGLTTLLAHLSLTQSYWLDSEIYTAYNSPSWSISDELFFYLLFPFIVMVVAGAISKFGRRALWLGALTLIIPLTIPWVPTEWHHAVYYIHPFSRLAEFFLGVLLFNFFRDHQASSKANLLSWLEVGSLALLIAFVAAAGGVSEVYRYAAYYWVPMVVLIGVFAYQKGVVSRWLAHPAWQLLGEISFAFYMIHRPVMWYYERVKNKFLPYDNVLVDVGTILLLTLVASYLLYTFFERPVGRWLKGSLGGRVG